jgi:uncharacterized RDD family membrane protein YckC
MPATQQVAPPGVAVRQSSGYQPATAEFAGFWIRFLAVIIDGLVLGVVLGPLEGAAVASNSVSFVTISSILAVLIVYTYNILMVWRFQATLGKMAMGIKVFNTDGTAPGFGTAFVREISKIPSALCCYLGFIWAGFDADKQAWHDKIAKTYVVFTR